MIFNSLSFLIFFPIITFIYFIIPFRVRWVWLLLCNYYFYMCWNPKYAILIATSTVITYLSGLLIQRANGIEDKKKSILLKKIWVLLSFGSNLGILFFFKYYNFFSLNVIKLFSQWGISISMPSFKYMLPVGISFYTFQALSYTIDVYRGEVKAEKNLGKYALFVSFFPNLLAGPIEKSKNLLHQFNHKHSFDYNRVKNGLLLMLWGFFQKVFVADRLAILVNTVYDNPQNYRGFSIILATIFFAFQIYCDFSSYSDIALGVAQVMGYRLSVNFERPYFSKSIKEFWRRWHITLGAWFRDYLYFPLGGSRCSRIRTYFNIMVVFLVSGLWHGAAVNFVIWGALHGCYQVLGDVLRPIKKRTIKAFRVKTDVLSYKLFQILVTFCLVDFAWIFFRANSFSDAKTLIKNMIYFNPWIFIDGSIYNLGLDQKDFKLAILGITLILMVNMMQRVRGLRIRLSEQNTIFRWAIYFTVLMFILIYGIYGPGYDKQQFIYFQF